MNQTVFVLRADERVATALEYFSALRIGCAPVVDEHRVPLGVVGWKDMMARPPSDTVGEAMSVPPRSVPAHATVEDAALELDRHDLHHLVVVDVDGLVIGFTSALDVLRGVFGRPTPHPGLFPQFHNGQQLAWSSDSELSAENVVKIGRSAGFVAVLGDVEQGEGPEILLSEATADMQRRLLEAVSRAHGVPRALREFPSEGRLAFRVAPFQSSAALAGPGEGTLTDFIRAAGAATFLTRATPPQHHD